MYIVVLVTHSWLRWVVLALGGALLFVAGRSWAGGPEWGVRADRLRTVFLRTLDVQFLLGVALFLFLSPLSRAGFGELGGAMGDPILRFYTVEHAFGMLVGVSIAHLGLDRAGKADFGRRARVVTITLVFWAVVTLASVPWPIAAYGRPLFRM